MDWGGERTGRRKESRWRVWQRCMEIDDREVWWGRRGRDKVEEGINSTAET
jgi:hypothetical protein